MKKVLFMLVLLTIIACNKRTEQITIIGHDGKDGKDGKSIVSMYNETSEIECSSSGTRLDLYLDMDSSLSVSEGDSYINSLIVCNGSNGLNGLTGNTGVDGKSAYEIAIENGFEGTETDWLLSLVGPQGEMGPQGLVGETGPQGLTGATGSVGATGSTGATGMVGPAGVAGTPGPTGPQGPMGPQGLQGSQGSSGATITLYSSTSCTHIMGTTSYVKVQGLNVQFFNTSTCASSSKLAEVSQGESFWVTGVDLAVYDNSSMRLIHFN